MLTASELIRVHLTTTESTRSSCTALGSDGQGPKGFSFIFLVLFDFFDLFALGTSMLGFLGASVEVVRGRASTYGSHNRTLSGPVRPLDRETGPDLTSGWQWTLAVVVCAGRARGRL